MSIQRNQLRKQVVDGQELLFPSHEQLEQIVKDGTLDGKPWRSAFLNEIKHVKPCVLKYPELSIATGTAGIWDDIIYTLVQIGEGIQRVHLERLTCEVCGWQGMTANPQIIDVYFGVPKEIDTFELMRYARKQYPVIPCPTCQSKLPRHPIWVEY